VLPKPTETSSIIVGVDTHKDEHMACGIDGLGRAVGPPCPIPATSAGYRQLLDWADSLGPVHSFGIEGCGSYGAGLARFLRRNGRCVREVARPVRKGERRLCGKSDAIDAEHAARTLLAGVGTATPKLYTGQVEAIRLVKIARDSAVKARTASIITLKSVLVTAPSTLRERLEPLTDHKLMLACVELEPGTPSSAELAAQYTLRMLAQRWQALHREVLAHTAQLKALTTDAAPELLAAFGVGFDSAAELLIAAGDNPQRIRSEAAFAKLCGACPIPTGSGKTSGRHRLNRGGNRQANAALYRIVIVRMRSHPPTMAYVERRTGEGLNKKDIIRCLKRFVVREMYRRLPALAQVSWPSSAQAA
jgi:transposase